MSKQIIEVSTGPVSARWLGGVDYTNSVAGVLGGAGRAVGLEVSPEAADGQGLGIEACEKICVLVADGLGYHNLTERAGHAPYLRRHLDGAAVLDTVCPTTTVAALTSICTGSAPGQTGMLGYSLRDPANGAVFDLISWRGARSESRRWQTRPTHFEGWEKQRPGSSVAVIDKRHLDSALTGAFLRGAKLVGAKTLAERVEVAVEALRRPEVKIVYLYWEGVDHAGHQYGWRSGQWGAALEELDGCVRQLRGRLGKKTGLYLTADHGMVDTRRAIDIAADPRLRKGVAAVAGEPRALHAYLERPAEAQEVAKRWSALLDADVHVVASAAAEGLFGPDFDARHLAACGDIVAFMHGQDVLVDSRAHTPTAISLPGVHGSLTDYEIHVPLLSIN